MSTRNLNTDLLKKLGTFLIEISDSHPMQYRTERHFHPLVMAFCAGADLAIQREFSSDEGRIDFRIGTNNPSLLELAVVPRQFQDVNHKDLQIRGHSQTTQAQRSANGKEVKKLMAHTTRTATRCLLIVNLASKIDESDFRKKYLDKWPPGGNKLSVTVVVVSRGHCFEFTIGGKKKGPRPKAP
jgi:hypothetical protein